MASSPLIITKSWTSPLNSVGLAKVKQERNEDRLSKLPEELIVDHIISLLPTVEAIRTSILSKRWRNIWSKTRCLNFVFYGENYVENDDQLYSEPYEYKSSSSSNDESSSEEEDSDSSNDEEDYKDEDEEKEKKQDAVRRHFFDFVKGALLLHQSSKIDSFKVGCEFSEEHREDVTNWIHFATLRKAETIHLSLHGKTKFEYEPKFDYDNETFTWELYVLPKHLYVNRVIKDLELSCCNFQPTSTIHWTCLTTLVINFSVIEDSLIDQILTGSPGLKSLTLGDCKGFSTIDTSLSFSLSTLVIDGFSEGGPIVLDICVSKHLDALHLTGNIFSTRCLLTGDKCSLKEVVFGFRAGHHHGGGHEPMYVVYKYMLVDLLSFAYGVHSLRVGNWCIKVLSLVFGPNMFFLLFPNCKRMLLDTLLTKQEIPGVLGLLEHSPNLEELLATSFPINNAQLQFSPHAGNYCSSGTAILSDKSFYSHRLELSLKNLKKFFIQESRTRRYTYKSLAGFTHFLLTHTSSRVEMLIYREK